MSTRRQIEKLIEKTEQEVKNLEREAGEKRAYCQGLKDTLRFLPKDVGAVDVSAKLKPGSDLAKARDILKATGKAMHINDILKLLKKEQTKENRVSLSGSMGFYVRKQEIFTRPGPNIFGLVEFDSAPTTAEPPEDFGLGLSHAANE